MSGNFKQIYISKLEGVTDLSLHLQDALQQIPQLYHDLPLLQVDAELEGEGVATITVT
jgi:hypothetical protein